MYSLFGESIELYYPTVCIQSNCLFLFAAFEAANFQIEFFGNPVMRTAQRDLSDATHSECHVY